MQRLRLAERVAGGVQQRAAVVRDQRFHRGGEGGMPDSVGEVDDGAVDPRPEASDTMPVVRDEAHERDPDDTAGWDSDLGRSKKQLGLIVV